MDAIVNQRGSLAAQDVLDYSEDADNTAGVNLQGRPILGLLIPEMNDAPDITFEVSVNNGDDFVPVTLADGDTPAITLTGGAAGYFVSSDLLTPLAGYVGRVDDDVNVLVRLAFSASQEADREVLWMLVG